MLFFVARARLREIRALRGELGGSWTGQDSCLKLVFATLVSSQREFLENYSGVLRHEPEFIEDCCGILRRGCEFFGNFNDADNSGHSFLEKYIDSGSSMR